MTISRLIPKTELPIFSLYHAELSSDNTDIVRYWKEGEWLLGAVKWGEGGIVTIFCGKRMIVVVILQA